MILRTLPWHLFLLLSVTSGAADDWNPTDEVPEIKIIGSSSSEEKKLAQDLRADLIRQLTYWKQYGLPDPPNLEGIYYIPNINKMKIRKLVADLNPSIPDVAAHVEEQYEALKSSRLIALAKQLQAKLAADPQTQKFAEALNGIEDKVFDQYAKFRYGFSEPGFREAIQKNNFIDKGEIQAEFADNAYLGKFPKINLTALLAPDSDPDASAFFKIGAKEFIAIGQDEKNLSRRIVLLPRTTQGKGDLAVSTLKDFSVSRHEMGHHQNSIAAPNLHRLLEEVFADYHAAAPLSDAQIGKVFANATGEIAQRLREQNPPLSKEYNQAFFLDSLARKKVLRDMSEWKSIDDIRRFVSQADDYHGGDPLRSFLWTLRESFPEKASTVDHISTQALMGFGRLPATMSGYAQSQMQMRGFFENIGSFLRGLRIRKKLTDRDLDNLLDVLSLDPNTLSISKGLTAEEQKAEGLEQLEHVIGRRKAQIQGRAERRLESQIRRRELSKNPFFGVAARPASNADYLTPEFIRSMYREAQKSDPAIAAKVKEIGEKIMRSSAVEIDVGGGAKELVFFRKPLSKIDPAARLKAKSAMTALKKLREQLAQPNLSEKETVRLTNKYKDVLDGVQEFERTGSTLDLFMPHKSLRAFSGVTGFLGKHLVSKTEEVKGTEEAAAQASGCQKSIAKAMGQKL